MKTRELIWPDSIRTARFLALAFLFPAVALTAEKPEAVLAAAKKISADRPWRVDARIEADKQMQISGIVAGNDFDLTIAMVDGTRRQITLSGKSWISGDGGKTWKDADPSDRRFYYLVHTPIKFSPEEKIPPHEIVPPAPGETEPLMHVRFKAPDALAYEGDRPNWWIVTENGRPAAIRRYHGPGVFENDYVTTDVTYSPISDSPPITAPPGNPDAVAAESGPEVLLMAAMKKMNEGVWQVTGTASFTKSVKVHGLLAGRDFDLTMEPEDGNPIRRLIVIQDKAWASADGGQSFHKGSPDDRLLYALTHTPIVSGRLEPPFEKVGAEQHDGATWLHIRLKVEEKTDETKLPQYWLRLDPQGQADYIARASVPVINPGSNNPILCNFEYAPAKEAITPPPPELVKTVGPDAPAGDKVYTFTEIEKQKPSLLNKVVRLRFEPKIIMSEDRGNGNYRCMVKDKDAADGRFGYVVLSGEALVKLGLLKEPAKGNQAWSQLQHLQGAAKEPVTVYVQVLPSKNLGQVDLVALGSRFSGTGPQPGYGW